MRARLGFVVSAIGLAVGACQPKAPAAPQPAPAPPDGVQYCAAWMLRHMQPYCWHSMTAEQASHRSAYTKLTTVAGRVARVEYRRGAGGYAQDETDDVGFTVRSEADTTTFVWFNQWETPTVEWRIRGLVMKRFTPWGTPSRSRREDAYILEYTLDAGGFVAMNRFVDERGQPAMRDGVHATRFFRDASGEDIGDAVFDAAGMPTVRPEGIHKTVVQRGTLGCRVGWQRFDAAGRPQADRMGVARGTATCDAYGNVTARRWFDGAGAPIVDADGIHGWDETLDEHGSPVTSMNVGLDGKPAPANGAESGIRYRHDARGYMVEQSLLGPRGEPFVSVNGNSGRRFTRGAHGEALEVTNVDANGHPVADRGGVARWRTEYEPNGAVRSLRYFDANDAPVAAGDGVPAVRYVNDARGLQTGVVLLDADGRSALGRGGYASVRYQRDEEGRVVGRTHLDLDGAVVLVPGARTMWFTYAGADVTAPQSIPRDEGQRRASEALSRLRAREPWENVGQRMSASWDKEARYGGKVFWYEPLWDAIAALKPGDPPVLVDTPRGYIIVERKE